MHVFSALMLTMAGTAYAAPTLRIGTSITTQHECRPEHHSSGVKGLIKSLFKKGYFPAFFDPPLPTWQGPNDLCLGLLNDTALTESNRKLGEWCDSFMSRDSFSPYAPPPYRYHEDWCDLLRAQNASLGVSRSVWCKFINQHKHINYVYDPETNSTLVVGGDDDDKKKRNVQAAAEHAATPQHAHDPQDPENYTSDPEPDQEVLNNAPAVSSNTEDPDTRNPVEGPISENVQPKYPHEQRDNLSALKTHNHTCLFPSPSNCNAGLHAIANSPDPAIKAAASTKLISVLSYSYDKNSHIPGPICPSITTNCTLPVAIRWTLREKRHAEHALNYNATGKNMSSRKTKARVQKRKDLETLLGCDLQTWQAKTAKEREAQKEAVRKFEEEIEQGKLEMIIDQKIEAALKKAMGNHTSAAT